MQNKRQAKKQKPKKQRSIKSKKRRFHTRCVQIVKTRSGGYIHPRDTSWDGLAYGFECILNLEHVKEGFYERCLRLAQHLGVNRADIPDVHLAPARDERLNFYSSFQWKKLRYATLVRHGAVCQCCGDPDASVAVDHIKPISKYWELRLDPENMQVLCNDCNWGKLNLDETDWRSK